MISSSHAKYYAYALTATGGTGAEKLRQSLLSASVDLNPHQIDAALFALRSPLSKGVLLADEVGLGKTIEAGLVLCQLWMERKRHLLVICPASLRKQWQCELQEKFNLPAELLDEKRYNQARKEGIALPFEQKAVIIVSYQYASKRKDEIKTNAWDCVVMDEVHKLRNAYRESNRLGQNLRWALEDRRKLLLSATPLQNSLTELYGITTLLDPTLFGDLASFRARYVNEGGDQDELKDRLKDFCHRTLRKDVLEYVKFTNRYPITINFEGTREELDLYEQLSKYLQDETTYAFSGKKRHMMVMLVRKLLASSTAALKGTLEKILARLESLRADEGTRVPEDALIEAIFDEEEGLEDIIDEDMDELDDDESPEEENIEDGEQKIDQNKLKSEIELVKKFLSMANRIGTDSKTRCLLSALSQGWKKLEELGAARKAVIFTESCRSMEALRNYLENNGYAGKVLCYSGGGNRNPRANELYEAYRTAHPDDKSSKAVLVRHAILESFKNDAEILIATEAGAEGINLQFCSMVVNYDLPWNPQRVEQRIGRCHRYGQKFDVVVINFINSLNAADARVFDLLQQKFSLFSGIFGASNDILGAFDRSGISVERRIHEIFQQCRTPQEIQQAFDQLNAELEQQIKERMEETKQAIIDNLDAEVAQHLKLAHDSTRLCMDEASRQFWELTKFILKDYASFDDEKLTFDLSKPPKDEFPAGVYSFNKKENTGIAYRPNSELGEWVIEQGLSIQVPDKTVAFSSGDFPFGHISVVEQKKGASGYLMLNHLHLDSIDAEDFLLFSAISDKGDFIDHEFSTSLFKVGGNEKEKPLPIPLELNKRLTSNASQFAKATVNKFAEANNRFFQEETLKLERWCKDQIAVVTRQIERLCDQQLEKEREILQAESLELQMPLQKQMDEIRRDIRKARRQVEEVEDEMFNKRHNLLEALQRKLIPNQTLNTLFSIRWTIE